MNPFKTNKFSEKDLGDNIISFITGDFIDGNTEIDNKLLKDKLPILPLRNTIIFPGSTLPISVGRKKSLELVKSLGKRQRYVGLVCQKDTSIEDPEKEDLYQLGVIAEVIRVIELADNNFSIIVQAKKRFEWLEITQTEPFMKATYKLRETVEATKGDKEFKAILDSIRESMLQMLQIGRAHV